MATTSTQLHLAFAFPERGHHSPTIDVYDENGLVRGRILTVDPTPTLPFEDESIASVDARDILEHVQDEQTWLAELARVLMPAGELILRVPLENLMAWADALNIYRYISDTTGRGGHPRQTIPTGWHRHYAPDDIPQMLDAARFETLAVSSQGIPFEEAPQLLGLVVGNVLLQKHETERRLHRLRRRFRDRPRVPLPRSVAAKMTVRARRTEQGYTPDPDVDMSREVEAEATGPLE
jgi:SAM-dependent methyltransferase